MWKRAVIPALLCCIAAIVPGAQNPLQLTVDVELVTVEVHVDDAAGRPVTNLTREDFTILEDGEPREIRSFEAAENPYNILLLFDRSASTAEQWGFLGRAISRFTSQLADQHRVALAAFDERPQMLLDWKSPAQFSRQAFPILLENSGTNVYRALEWAADQLSKVQGRKGAVVLTDGLDNRLSSSLVSFDRNDAPVIARPEADRDFQKMLRTVAQSHIPFYFVAVNTDQNPDPRTEPNAFDLQQRAAARLRMEIVADRSNGSVRYPRELEELSALYEKIGRELGHSYGLSFAPGAVGRDGAFHRVEIRVRDSSLRVNQARTGYYAR
jgi:Ca-activated chloride channel family protein